MDIHGLQATLLQSESYTLHLLFKNNSQIIGLEVAA